MYNSGNAIAIDLFCEHTKEGEIIPIKIRLIDEDGGEQSYTIKAYRDISENGLTVFECKIKTFNTIQVVKIFSSLTGRNRIWYIRK